MDVHVHVTSDSEQCWLSDLSSLISAIGVTDIYSRQYLPKYDFFLVVCDYTSYQNLQKKILCPTHSLVKKRGTRQALCLCMQSRKHS